MSPREKQCPPRRSQGWHCFSRGNNFPCYPLVQSIFIILYWTLIKYIVYITFAFKTIQVKWIFEFVFHTPLIQTSKWCQSESKVNRTHINSAQSIFFWNITRRQAISPVAKFHHVLGHGFMIRWVILIFIQCLSANQNQQFYKKVYYKQLEHIDIPLTHFQKMWQKCVGL